MGSTIVIAAAGAEGSHVPARGIELLAESVAAAHIL
jgi:hypothetical protein